MAITQALIDKYDCPSVWGETDCRYWLADLIDADLTRSVWAECETEREAVKRAIEIHESPYLAMVHDLQSRGYHSLDTDTLPWEPDDIIILDDVQHGVCIGGLTSTYQLLVRVQIGVVHGEGTILALLRK